MCCQGFDVDGGLKFTTSKNPQNKHKCSSENIANFACLANSRCSFSKIMANKGLQPKP
jgi:hypothetical protein